MTSGLPAPAFYFECAEMKEKEQLRIISPLPEKEKDTGLHFLQCRDIPGLLSKGMAHPSYL